MSINISGQLGGALRNLRISNRLLLRKVASDLDVDQSLLCKFERGNRLPACDFVIRVAQYFSADEKELMALWLCDKFFKEARDSNVANRALKIAEQRIRYITKQGS